MSSAEIAVFARLPVAGKVKTRLAAGVGPEKAALFYRSCAEHILTESSRYVDQLICYICAQIAHAVPPSQVFNISDKSALLCSKRLA